jgi:hypothetical protein
MHRPENAASIYYYRKRFELIGDFFGEEKTAGPDTFYTRLGGDDEKCLIFRELS